jgi:hypothetical protein
MPYNGDMKKVLILIIIILVGVIIFLLPKHKNGDKNKTEELVQSDTETKAEEGISTSKNLFAGERKETIHEESEHLLIDVEYPSFKSETFSKKVKSFIDTEIAQFKNDNDPDKLPVEDKAFLFQNGAKWSLNITYKTHAGDHISSIVFSISDYTGGAHGGLNIKTLNYDTSGEILSIGDLFKEGTNYLSKLSELSRTKLKDGIGTNGTWIDDGTKPITDNFKPFYIEGDNLYIIFQPYQVAPWVNGTPEIKISKDELQDFIKETIF